MPGASVPITSKAEASPMRPRPLLPQVSWEALSLGRLSPLQTMDTRMDTAGIDMEDMDTLPIGDQNY